MSKNSTFIKRTRVVHDEDGRPVGEEDRTLPEHIPADSTTQTIEEVRANVSDHKKIIMRGHEFVCVSCECEHSLPIDPFKYTLNHQGEIVPRA